MNRLGPLLAFNVGAWLGLLAAAAFVRRTVPSLGDEASDTVSLVAVLNGITLKSRARAFGGGSMLAWFGGIEVDLREAGLAPGAHLSVSTLFGGIAIKTPPEWRVESHVNLLLGGVDARTPATDPDAPVLVVDGLAVLGGVAIGARAA
jgi:hypothetical protein